ncbi:uncharacterized protein LOC136039000 [Artemia franciscana]|uniref:uncharacterized protein LOC136039000 n=1 Tax=Artemia franciscana TaxID=6661 RepID=UPI0032DABF4D
MTGTEYRFKHQQETNQIFIGFITSFDSVHGDAICIVMRQDGVPEKIIIMSKACYDGTGVQVRVDMRLSDLVLIVEVIRQGCVLSPTLFNFAIDWIFMALEKYKDVEVGLLFSFTLLRYTDDLEILETVTDVQALINEVGAAQHF